MPKKKMPPEMLEMIKRKKEQREKSGKSKPKKK